jgi:transcriptional regulator with XRE-family HTH domain
LATKLGIRRDSFSQALSRNNLDMDYLRRIATALEVPIWQLFAAPEDVQDDGINITCPHCAKTIKIHIQAD